MARFHRVLIFVALLGAVPALPASAVEPIYVTATVTNVDATHHTITVAPLNPPANVAARVTSDSPGLKDALTGIAIGDRVDVTLRTPTSISDLKPSSKETSWGMRIGVFGGWFVVLFLLVTLVTWGEPRQFIIGADQRYSNSKTQMTFWFGAVISAYLATISLRVWAGGFDFLGGVDIPSNLLVLSGLSALTFGGAKAITTQKINSVVAKGFVSPKAGGAPNILTDLFQNDQGEADIGDFQMILISAIAVVMFAVSVLNALAVIKLQAKTSLPDVDTTLLSLFGIGQGAYLVKKLGSNPGQG